jgi:hypothetical protein
MKAHNSATNTSTTSCPLVIRVNQKRKDAAHLIGWRSGVVLAKELRIEVQMTGGPFANHLSA